VIVFGLTLLLLASIVGAYAVIERYVAQVDLARAATALNAGNLDEADTLAASSLSFATSATAYQAQAQIAQTRLQQIAASTTLSSADAQQQFQTALSAGINAALTATQVAPNDYQNWMMLGNLYATVVPLNVSGAYDNAKTAYEKAETLNPTSPVIPYSLAQLAISNKDVTDAETYLKQAITLKQDYTDAIFLLSQVEVQSGDLKDALTAAEAAAYFTPTDPNVLFQLGLLRAASGDTAGAIQALMAAVSANAQFANARYFLAAAYEKNGDSTDALAQLQAIAALSSANATAVNPAITSLQAGKDPFPSNLLSASSTPPISQ
jgi:cytochrome c-type biogenesis protein CcmH/NrfG